MKKILSMLMVLTLIFVFSACTDEKTNNGGTYSQKESENSQKATLTSENAKNIISAYDNTVFVINPDKTVSVSGTNNGHCEINDWTDIEKIFTTHTATYGIQSDGTCLVSENFTSYIQPKFNNAQKITNSLVLLSDGSVVPRLESNVSGYNYTYGYTVHGTEKLPKCVDILEFDESFFCVTQEGKVQHYSLYLNMETGYSIEFEKETAFNKSFNHLNNIKEVNYYKYYGLDSRLHHISFVDNNGNAYTYYHHGDVDCCRYGHIADNNWPQVTSCVPVGKLKYIATTTEKKVVGCGGEFNEIGGNTPKIILPENALKVFNFYGMKDGKNFGYAIVICEDFSAVAYRSSGSIPYNMSNAFSMWNSFEWS